MASSTAINWNGVERGGFMQPSALSPATSTSTVTPSMLPKQRSHPLRPGSMKETTVINHVDNMILAINRRHAKKFSSAFEQQQQQQQQGPRLANGFSTSASTSETAKEGEKETGYESFKEVARDIESLIDVLWVSGTPSLQIPYLISLSVLVNTYLPSYPFTSNSTFRLLRKLDSFFASLITGEDAETGQTVSGFEKRQNIVSMTEKVRIKSIAETARVVVVEAGEDEEGGLSDPEDDDEDDDELDFGDDSGFGLGDTQGPGKREMEIARVYEKTIQLLGDELGKAGEFCDEDMAKGEEGENCI